MKIYVIMPVGADPGYTSKKEIIKRNFRDVKVDFHFPDYCQVNPSFDLKSTLREIESADRVLVDLSYERPSCYYELGLAQALNKNILLIAIEGTAIHQACGRENVIYYKNNNELPGLLLEELKI